MHLSNKLKLGKIAFFHTNPTLPFNPEPESAATFLTFIRKKTRLS